MGSNELLAPEPLGIGEVGYPVEYGGKEPLCPVPMGPRGVLPVPRSELLGPVPIGSGYEG